jgi:hypothetical protein
MTVMTPQLPARLAGWRLELAWLLPPLIAHGLGLAFYVNWADAIGNAPFHYTDYATHYAAVDAVSHFLGSGRLWGYSPFFHAGFAEGTLFDIDNKGIELGSYLLSRAGLSLPHAFNLVVLVLMACAPFAIYAAARMLGLLPVAAGLAQWLMLIVWYADGSVRWMWQGSTLAFASAALGSLLVSAAFWKWAAGRALASSTSGAAGGRTALLIWFGLGPLLFWLHAETFVVLVVTLGAGTLLFGRRWQRPAWLVLLGWSALVILVNWPWLGPNFRFLYTLAATPDLQGGLDQLRYDATAPHALLRLAILVMALFGVALWRRSGAPWWRLVAVCIGVWLVLAYAGGYLGLGALQPYRFILLALSLASLPAAGWLVGLSRQSPRAAVLALTVLAIVAAPPMYWARPQGLRQVDGTPTDSLSGPQPAEHSVCQTLAGLDLAAGRVMTNDWRLGAWLPACSGAQVIGGPYSHVWTQFNHANADQEHVSGQLVATISPADLASVLSQYNVHWVVVNTAFRNWENLVDWDRKHPGTFAPLAQHGPFQILSVVEPSSWFFEGAGAVTADYNRLAIRGATPGSVVLKYHWLQSLRTEPVLPLRPVLVGGDPIPFIAVDNGETADFEIIQSYD